MTCRYCKGEVDPQDRTAVQRVVGWERKGSSSSRRGGSDILLRERREEFAHAVCVSMQQRGLNALQGSLDGVPR
jgi:hypothetical protein